MIAFSLHYDRDSAKALLQPVPARGAGLEPVGGATVTRMATAAVRGRNVGDLYSRAGFAMGR